MSTWQPKIHEHVLCKRIPTWPYGDPKDRHVVDYDEYVRTGGYEGLRKALTMKPAEVVEAVKQSMLRGRGGAGFPTGLKWSFMPPVDPNVPRFLCCNGDESEPGTFKDRQLMEYNPHLVFEGMLLACYAISAKAGYLYIRGEYADWITHMERELEKAYAKGYVGKNIMGSDFSCDIVIHKGAGAYICGEESSLMESLEGKRAYPRIKPPFPAQRGIWGYPTTINNVETLACVPLILNRGGEWYAKIGAEKHPGPVLYGISGHVNRPGVYEYPTGMLITDLIHEVAGGIRGGKKLKAVIPGGSSTPPLRADMIDGVTMDAESLREAGSMMGTAGLLVMDEDTDMVAWLRRVTHFYHHESCGQCTPCREGTGWLYQLMTRIEQGQANTKDLDMALEIATSMGSMPGTTICGLADGNNWALRTIMNKFRDEFESRVRPSHVPVKMTIGAAAHQ
ncbi:MAG: NADH-quinone oxidoreductase subunit F [Phycisphaerales bacterium]|nr:MAG: NADH-quinone oxidoreductase subunit F [Phycisphaerales bacterium]